MSIPISTGSYRTDRCVFLWTTKKFSIHHMLPLGLHFDIPALEFQREWINRVSVEYIFNSVSVTEVSSLGYYQFVELRTIWCLILGEVKQQKLYSSDFVTVIVQETCNGIIMEQERGYCRRLQNFGHRTLKPWCVWMDST